MTIETQRLILRPWRESDADDLYEYAKDPRVGPAAGWNVHTSPEMSLEIIRTVLSEDGTFAVTIKGSDKPVGSIGAFKSRMTDKPDALEIGYWIAVPFWGSGYIPEATKRMIDWCFAERGAETVWCGHYEGNDKSRRVVEKCGFKYVRDEVVDVPLLGEKRREFMYIISKEDWMR